MSIDNKLLQWISINEENTLPVRTLINACVDSNKLKSNDLGDSFIQSLDLLNLGATHPITPKDIVQCMEVMDIMTWHDKTQHIANLSDGWAHTMGAWSELYGHYLDGDMTEIQVILKSLRKKIKAAENYFEFSRPTLVN